MASDLHPVLLSKEEIETLQNAIGCFLDSDDGMKIFNRLKNLLAKLEQALSEKV